jgi:hypothetical protein
MAWAASGNVTESKGDGLPCPGVEERGRYEVTWKYWLGRTKSVRKYQALLLLAESCPMGWSRGL